MDNNEEVKTEGMGTEMPANHEVTENVIVADEEHKDEEATPEVAPEAAM